MKIGKIEGKLCHMHMRNLNFHVVCGIRIRYRSVPPSSILSLSTFLDKCKKLIHYITKSWIWRGGTDTKKIRGIHWFSIHRTLMHTPMGVCELFE